MAEDEEFWEGEERLGLGDLLGGEGGDGGTRGVYAAFAIAEDVESEFKADLDTGQHEMNFYRKDREVRKENSKKYLCKTRRSSQ